MNQLIKDMGQGKKDDCAHLAGAIQVLDWLTSGDVEGYAMKVLGLVDLDHAPIQDYMVRDSDTSNGAQ